MATATAVAEPISVASDPLSAACRASEEEVAQLAYSYWQTRGCPEGSPDEDWFRAEGQLATPTAKVAGA